MPGLGGALRAPDPGELGARLDAPALVEHRLVDRELDAVGPQPVAMAERERGRNDARANTVRDARVA